MVMPVVVDPVPSAFRSLIHLLAVAFVSVLAFLPLRIEGFLNIHHRESSTMLRTRILSCGATRLARPRTAPHNGFAGCSANFLLASQSQSRNVLNPFHHRNRRTHLFSSLSVVNATSHDLPPFDVAEVTDDLVPSPSPSSPRIRTQEEMPALTNPQPTLTFATATDEASHPEAVPELDGLGVKSRPRPDGKGMWKPEQPDWWYKGFGSRSEERRRRLEPLIRLLPGDEGYFDVSDIRVPMVTVVRTAEDARTVMGRLMGPDAETRFHACDTEVMDLDLKSVGPVGNGYVTCASVYSGEDFDYGLGDGPGTVLWIDNLDDACGVLQEFKAWFEDERFKKIWHNYGFDRHVMWNEGIDCRGFGGDTMHMARLEDSSRSREGNGNGYSLEALTEELVGRRKRPMKEIFGIKRLRKDGSEGSIIDLPPVEVMQRDPAYRSKWIEYGCYDAQGTFLIHKELRKRLCRIPWRKDEKGEMTNNLYEYYWQHMRPFGEVLTDMERRGYVHDIAVAAVDFFRLALPCTFTEYEWTLGSTLRRWNFRPAKIARIIRRPSASGPRPSSARTVSP